MSRPYDGKGRMLPYLDTYVKGLEAELAELQHGYNMRGFTIDTLTAELTELRRLYQQREAECVGYKKAEKVNNDRLTELREAVRALLATIEFHPDHSLTLHTPEYKHLRQLIEEKPSPLDYLNTPEGWSER